MDILKSFSPTLHTVSIVGVVDRRWMVVVANLINVTVQARNWRDTEWVTVQPRT